MGRRSWRMRRVFPSLTVLSSFGGLFESGRPGDRFSLRGIEPVNHTSERSLGPELTVARHREPV